MLITRPQPRSIIPGTTAFVTLRAPLKLRSRMRSQKSSVVSRKVMKSSQPAQLTATSIAPSRPTTRATASLTDVVLVTSTDTAVASPPTVVISVAVASAASRLRSATATWNPASASASEMPLPMPDAPPVTNATLLLIGFSVEVPHDGGASSGLGWMGEVTGWGARSMGVQVSAPRVFRSSRPVRRESNGSSAFDREQPGLRAPPR